MNHTLTLPADLVIPSVQRISSLLETMGTSLPTNQQWGAIIDQFAEYVCDRLIGINQRHWIPFTESPWVREIPQDRLSDFNAYVVTAFNYMFTNIQASCQVVMQSLYRTGEDIENCYFVYRSPEPRLLMVIESAPTDQVMTHLTGDTSIPYEVAANAPNQY